MKNERLLFLSHHFASYEIQFSKDGDFAEIKNPSHAENIKVEYVPDDDFTPYIVYFAFQHCHMCDEEDVLEYINEVMSENKFSIEFFCNETRRFGTDINAKELSELSYETLEKEIGYWGITKLKDVANVFKVRGWNAEKSFDARFALDEGGNVIIEKY